MGVMLQRNQEECNHHSYTTEKQSPHTGDWSNKVMMDLIAQQSREEHFSSITCNKI